MKNIVSIVLITGLVFSAAGCSRPREVVSSDPVCLPRINTSAAMEAARAVLEDMRFSIEKYDPDALYIRTRPLSGAQFFEFWRQDNASAYTAARANLQSLRRVVEIEATPYPDRTCLECRVYVQKLSLPEQPIRGSKRLAETYTESSATQQSLQIEPKQLEQMEWLDAGLDRDLEQKILTKIREKVSS
jgi:hypothetical protein